MPGIRVLLVDDHKLFRAGLRSLLQALDDVEVVAQADDGREALSLAKAHCPDVVLLDIMMPGLNGLDAVARIARACPRTRVIIVSMSAQQESVLRALRAGAVGYLVKTADPAELELAIRAVMRGERFLSSAVSEHVVAAWLKAPDKALTSLERLTPRQREVLQLVAEGHTTKEIARKLDISARTAETYRGELMKTLDIHDIASLTRCAIRAGLICAES
ncbi:MAG TPA: response regulator transcription factor [Burkholderiaceae bacterium]|jgi:DNA-binding NarL/FixJ family response regulator|nr:response regulator transcription factor [Burkholderiaceae bacterium]